MGRFWTPVRAKTTPPAKPQTPLQYLVYGSGLNFADGDGNVVLRSTPG